MHTATQNNWSSVRTGEVWRNRENQVNFAKRMQCARLAAAFERSAPSESRTKLPPAGPEPLRRGEGPHAKRSAQFVRRVFWLRQSLFCLAAVILIAGCSTQKPIADLRRGSSHSEMVSRLSAEAILQRATAKPSAPFEGEGWRALFDGKSLSGWNETRFAGGGEVEIKSGLLVLNMGDPFTGVNWTNDFPKTNYEVALDAMRVMGSDFFCGLTVPVGDSFCSLIVGGWGGGLVGISSLDGLDASENETTKYVAFEAGRWYRVRLRVTEKKIEAWIGAEKVADVATAGKRISLRPGEIEMSKPFGLASWETTAAIREIKIRRIQ